MLEHMQSNNWTMFNIVTNDAASEIQDLTCLNQVYQYTREMYEGGGKDVQGINVWGRCNMGMNYIA